MRNSRVRQEILVTKYGIFPRVIFAFPGEKFPFTQTKDERVSFGEPVPYVQTTLLKMSSIPIDGIPKSKQPVLVYAFNVPSTKKIALHNNFRLEDPVSKDNLAKTSAIRDEFVNAITSGSPSSIITVRAL